MTQHRKIGGISDILIEIEELLNHSSLSLYEISKVLNIPVEWVQCQYVAQSKLLKHTSTPGVK